MDIVGLARAQMLSALFAALDQPVSGLVKAGDKAEARVIAAPDREGIMLVALNGRQVPLAVVPQGAERPVAALPGKPASSGAPIVPKSHPASMPPQQASQQLRAAIPADELALLSPGRLLTAEIAANGQSLILTPRSLALPQGKAEQLPSAATPLQPVPQQLARPEPRILAASMALADASLKQQPLEKLLGQLGHLVRTQPNAAAEWPLPVRAAINRLLGAQIDGEEPITAKSLREILAAITGTSAQQVSPGKLVTGDGLKELFQLIRMQLGAPPETAQRQPAPAPVSTLQPHSQPEAARPEPGQPVRTPQGLPGLAADPAREEASALLRSISEAGEARVALTQITSRSEALLDPGRMDQKPVMAVELPIMLKTDTVAAEFRIDQEGGQEEAAEGRIWQARFSIDLPEAGPIHARAGIRGDTVAATLWAEDPGTAERMRAAVEELRAALAEQGLDVLDLRVLQGRPAYKGGPLPGQLLHNVA